MQEYVPSLSPSDIRNVQRSYELAREHLGEEIDIIVHCHCELDLPSAIAVAKAVEPIKPIYYEDPLQPGFSENWLALRRATTLPIMTGENLELPEQALMSGGITGTKRIADLAALYRMPVTLHSVSGILLNAASRQLGAAIFNCPRIECTRGAANIPWSSPNPLDISGGRMKISSKPGLGIDVDPDWMAAHAGPATLDGPKRAPQST